MQRVWIKGLWGFGFDHEGFLGFTRESARDSFLRQARPDDLVLIYGTASPDTDADNRLQTLGFVQVELTPIDSRTRMSPEAEAYRRERSLEDRWLYGMPVRRAWELQHKISINHLASQTYNSILGRNIASNGALLTEAEAERVLQLPVVEISVFGETPISAGNQQPMLDNFKSSKGLTPSFGTRTTELNDGEHRLYMLRASGNIAALLPDFEVTGKQLVKIGYSNEPINRRDAHNQTLPDAASFKWHLDQTSAAYPNGLEAKLAEDKLKEELQSRCRSLGGEFFLGDPWTLNDVFLKIAKAAVRIKVEVSVSGKRI